MPLGNLTSQFFANVYLNELDKFVKHKLKCKYYIRYVDDFVILHHSKSQLQTDKEKINKFLQEKLKIILHENKSSIYNLKNGINFLGFRIFYHYKLLRKSNIRNFERKFNQKKLLFDQDIIKREKVITSLEGWLTYASHANTFKFRKYIIRNLNKNFPATAKPINKRQFNFMKKMKENELQFSIQKTLFLYSRGFTIIEISEKRNIKESTVWSHLANLIGHNQLSLYQVLSKNKIQKILYKIYSKKDRLKSIKKKINDSSVTYDEINCVLASVKRKHF